MKPYQEYHEFHDIGKATPIAKAKNNHNAQLPSCFAGVVNVGTVVRTIPRAIKQLRKQRAESRAAKGLPVRKLK